MSLRVVAGTGEFESRLPLHSPLRGQSRSNPPVDNIGLPNSFPDTAARFWVVVSHGDFDISKSDNIGASRSSVAVPTPTPEQHATVAYVIIDAVTGAYKGEEFKYAGCSRE